MFDFLHATTSTANRATGLMAVSDMGGLAALRVSATRKHRITGVNRVVRRKDGSSYDRWDDATKLAASKFRSTIIADAKKANARKTEALMRDLPTWMLEEILLKQGHISFACPLLGTYAIVSSEDVAFDVKACGDVAATRRIAAENASIALQMACKPRELTAG